MQYKNPESFRSFAVIFHDKKVNSWKKIGCYHISRRKERY